MNRGLIDTTCRGRCTHSIASITIISLFCLRSRPPVSFFRYSHFIYHPPVCIISPIIHQTNHSSNLPLTSINVHALDQPPPRLRSHPVATDRSLATSHPPPIRFFVPFIAPLLWSPFHPPHPALSTVTARHGPSESRLWNCPY